MENFALEGTDFQGGDYAQNLVILFGAQMYKSRIT